MNLRNRLKILAARRIRGEEKEPGMVLYVQVFCPSRDLESAQLQGVQIVE